MNGGIDESALCKQVVRSVRTMRPLRSDDSFAPCRRFLLLPAKMGFAPC